MTDQEFIDFVETKVTYKMLSGCAMETHLGYKKYDPGSWDAGMNTGTVSRLLDLAKQAAKAIKDQE